MWGVILGLRSLRGLPIIVTACRPHALKCSFVKLPSADVMSDTMRGGSVSRNWKMSAVTTRDQDSTRTM